MYRGFTTIFILVGILVLAGLVGGAFYLGRQTALSKIQNPVVTSQTPQPTPTQPSSSSKIETVVLKEGYSFDIILPGDYQYKEEKKEII